VSARHIAISITGEIPREGATRALLSARQDGGNARSDWTLANDKTALAGDERFVAHLNAGNVGDGV
jgi:hypothetical protein